MSRVYSCLILSYLLICLPAFLGFTNAAAEVTSQMRLQSDSFVSPQFNSAPQKNYQFIGAHFFSDQNKPTDLKIDLRGAYAVGNPLMSHTNLKELAYIIPIGDRQKFSFGRMRDRWSELDRRWNFGVIEPVFKWNALNPESQGLTGLFWEVKDKGYKLSIFGSYLYLPNQGASFEIKNGEFERLNPWFSSPPSSIRVLNEVSKIEYVFERPKETDVVFQTTYGAKLDLGTDGPYRARGSIFYKPMNFLALGYDGTLDIPKDKGVVEINPQVIFHRVTSLDLAYVEKTYLFGLSVIQDTPTQENVFASKWTKPVFAEAILVSPWVEFKI
jgi:hypothetical protein